MEEKRAITADNRRCPVCGGVVIGTGENRACIWCARNAQPKILPCKIKFTGAKIIGEVLK